MSLLFTPLTVRGTAIRNRVVMPPMVMNFADRHGRVTEMVLEHYGKRATSAGLIIVEAAAVDPGGRCWPNGVNAFDDEHLDGLAQLARRIHAGGAVAGIQLVHGGPQGSPELAGGQTVGPSPVRHAEGAPVPRALTADEITAIEHHFAAAAARAVAAGFDLVEIHGAHGFLLDSFLSRRRNVRTDAYGGPLVNRMRMLVETCRLTRERIGTALLDCRISLFNKRGEDFTRGDLVQLVGGLESTGLDLLHVSTDGAFTPYFGTDRTIGQLVKEITHLPVIIAGGLGNPRDAERAIAEGHADFSAVGHGLLDDPAWAVHAEERLR